jgi:hypothetical protein
MVNTWRGGASWTLTKGDEQKQRTFEWKVLRKIYGPTTEKDGWGVIYNYELYDLHKTTEIAKTQTGETQLAGTRNRRKRDISVQEINFFQARRHNEGWKFQPKGAGWRRERSQNPWCTRLENKSAGPKLMEERGQYSHRDVAPVNKNAWRD